MFLFVLCCSCCACAFVCPCLVVVVVGFVFVCLFFSFGECFFVYVKFCLLLRVVFGCMCCFVALSLLLVCVGVCLLFGLFCCRFFFFFFTFVCVRVFVFKYGLLLWLCFFWLGFVVRVLGFCCCYRFACMCFCV